MRKPCFVICSIAALLLATVSCNKSKDGVVLIDPDKAVPAVLEDVACDIKVMPLKSDQPIPASTFYFFYDDYFFGTNQETDYTFTKVTVFDSQGNYIGTIDRHGRGHNEYLKLVNFAYHADNKQLYLYDMGPEIHARSTIFKFQLPQLEFLETQYPATMLDLTQVLHLGDGRSLISGHVDNGVDKLMVLEFQPDTVLLLKEYGEFGLNRISPTFYQLHFTNKDNPLIALFGYENSIYSFDDSDSLKHEFSFTFGLKGLPKSYADNQLAMGPYMQIITPEREEYMKDGSEILFDVPVKNGNLLSFMYTRNQYQNTQGFRHFYLTNGRKSANYSRLKVPGLDFAAPLIGVNGTSYVFSLEDVRVDPSAPLSPLGQQILDAVRSQNDDNPILLQFRFKDL